MSIIERLDNKWMPITKQWREYPAGTKAKCVTGGHWTKLKNNNWQWHAGASFPTPGGDAVEVCLPAENLVIEYNKIIAELLGWEFEEFEPGKFIARLNGEVKWSDDLSYLNHQLMYVLNYHYRWDRLMVAIEHIRKLPLLNAWGQPCTDPQDVCYPRTFGAPCPVSADVVLFRFNGFTLQKGSDLLEAAYFAVLEVAELNKNH